MAPKLPNTKLVYLTDREADIAALMRRARGPEMPVDWLVRSKHNRSLGGGAMLRESVGATESKGELRFMPHGTNHSNKPADVNLARRCPSLLNANQSIEDTLKFKIAKWWLRRAVPEFSAQGSLED
jgi:hypothetical protein